MKKSGTHTQPSQGAVTLTFRKENTLAYVVTDGLHYAIYTQKGRKFYRTMGAAIAALETRGYSIQTDLFT